MKRKFATKQKKNADFLQDEQNLRINAKSAVCCICSNSAGKELVTQKVETGQNNPSDK